MIEIDGANAQPSADQAATLWDSYQGRRHRWRWEKGPGMFTKYLLQLQIEYPLVWSILSPSVSRIGWTSLVIQETREVTLLSLLFAQVITHSLFLGSIRLNSSTRNLLCTWMRWFGFSGTNMRWRLARQVSLACWKAYIGPKTWYSPNLLSASPEN